MQSLVSYATVALLAVGGNALVTRNATIGTTSAETNYTITSGSAILGVQTYNNGTDLALNHKIYLTNFENTKFSASTPNYGIYASIAYLGANAAISNWTDAVNCTLHFGSSITPTAQTNNPTLSCVDGHFTNTTSAPTVLAFTVDNASTTSNNWISP